MWDLDLDEYKMLACACARMLPKEHMYLSLLNIHGPDWHLRSLLQASLCASCERLTSANCIKRSIGTGTIFWGWSLPGRLIGASKATTIDPEMGTLYERVIFASTCDLLRLTCTHPWMSPRELSCKAPKFESTLTRALLLTADPED